MPDYNLVKATIEEADRRTGGQLLTKVTTARRAMATKKVNPNAKWDVRLLVDRSYSMEGAYAKGFPQAATENVFGFSVLVDDDLSVPVTTFGGGIKDYQVDLNNYAGFFQKNRISPDGGTPLTEAIIRVATAAGHGDLFKSSGGGFFGGPRTEAAPTIRQSDKASLLVIVCDGAPNDPRSCAEAIRKLSVRSVSFKFLFVDGDDRGWQFLKGLDDDIPVGSYESGCRLFDNVDAQKVYLTDSDQSFAEKMLEELSDSRAAMVQHGLLNPAFA